MPFRQVAAPAFLASTWSRFRLLPGWTQILLWLTVGLFFWPVPAVLFAASRPAATRRRWWAVAAILTVAWVAVGAFGQDDARNRSAAHRKGASGEAAQELERSGAPATGGGASSSSRPETTDAPVGPAQSAGGGTTGTTQPPDGLSSTTRPTSPTRPAPATSTTIATVPTQPAPVTPDAAASLLAQLQVAPEPIRVGYDRELFPLWSDTDRDGCDTRREVLIAESRVPVTEGAGCSLSGEWVSLYDGVVTTDASTFDIDHVVALAEAWDSGASGWGTERRRAFANDLGYDGSLIAVSASSNRSKGDQDPAEWLPPRHEAWCEFAADWANVKIRWNLTADRDEVAALGRAFDTCAGAPGSTPPATAAPPAPADTTTTSGPAPVSPPGGSTGAIAISALDCRGEGVTATNTGGSAVDLSGWTIHDDGVKHTFAFPSGFVLAPGASVTVRSGGPAGPGELAWSGSPVWNNDGDVATLVDPAATVRSTVSC